jgi:hypothetical protein
VIIAPGAAGAGDCHGLSALNTTAGSLGKGGAASIFPMAVYRPGVRLDDVAEAHAPTGYTLVAGGCSSEDDRDFVEGEADLLIIRHGVNPGPRIFKAKDKGGSIVALPAPAGRHALPYCLPGTD